MEEDNRKSLKIQKKEEVISVIDKFVEYFDSFNYVKNDIKEELQKFSELSQNEVVNLVVLGGFNAGKTSLINSMIGSMINQSGDWYDSGFLMSCSSENTFFTTVIERSEDENFYIYEGYEGEKEVLQKVTLKDIKEFFKNKDEMSSKYFSKIAEKEIQDDEHSKAEFYNNDTDLPDDIVITVKVPGFSNQIRIIDTPGQTSYLIRERLLNFVKSKSLFSVFLLVRSLVQEKAIETDLYKTLKEINTQLDKSMFILAFTKYDDLIDNLKGSTYLLPYSNKSKLEIKNNDISKIKINLSSFYKKFSGERDKVTFITLQNSLGALDENELARYNANLLTDTLFRLIDLKGEEIKINCLKDKLMLRMHYYNEKISSEYYFKENEIEMFKESSKTAIIVFKNDIKDWASAFPKTLSDFKKKYKLKIENLRKVFEYNDSNVLTTKTYYYRNSYINDQSNLLKHSFNELINSEINEIVANSVSKVYDKLPELLVEKMKKLSEEKICLPFQPHNIVYFSFIPVVGDIIVAFSNLVKTIWTKKGCFDLIVEKFHQAILVNLKEIVVYYIEQFEEKINENCNDLVHVKNTMKEIKDLIRFIDEIKYTYEDQPFNYEEIYKKNLTNLAENTEELKAIHRFLEDCDILIV